MVSVKGTIGVPITPGVLDDFSTGFCLSLLGGSWDLPANELT